MREDFEDRLDELAARAGQAGRLGPAASARARGDQRRRRAAGAAVLSLVLLCGAGAGVAAGSDLWPGRTDAAPADPVRAEAEPADRRVVLPGAWMRPEELPTYGNEVWSREGPPALEQGMEDVFFPCLPEDLPGDRYVGQLGQYRAKGAESGSAAWQYTMFFAGEGEAARGYDAITEQLGSCAARARETGGDGTVERTVTRPAATAWRWTTTRLPAEFDRYDFHLFLVRAGSTVTAVVLESDEPRPEYDTRQDPAVLDALAKRACVYTGCRPPG